MGAGAGAGTQAVAAKRMMKNDGGRQTGAAASAGGDEDGGGAGGGAGAGSGGDGGGGDGGEWKIVYVAPMKALAAEVVDKFGSKLRPLGLRVRELTGDTQLSRAELADTHGEPAGTGQDRTG